MIENFEDSKLQILLIDPPLKRLNSHMFIVKRFGIFTVCVCVSVCGVCVCVYIYIYIYIYIYYI